MRVDRRRTDRGRRQRRAGYERTKPSDEPVFFSVWNNLSDAGKAPRRVRFDLRPAAGHNDPRVRVPRRPANPRPRVGRGRRRHRAGIDNHQIGTLDLLRNRMPLRR